MRQGLAVVAFLCAIALVLSAATDDIEVTTISKPEQCLEKIDHPCYVTVRYTGYLEDGRIFDTTEQPERGPFSFEIGAGKVIPGLEMGMKDMCLDEKRQIVIPPHLAYGRGGVEGVIPPDATLRFDVTLTLISELEDEPNFLGRTFVIATRILPYAAALGGIFWLLWQLKPGPAKPAKERKGKKGRGRQM